ncbi:hypothetical protein JL722_4783 [Aureococcus anophagefferens]|nr:hypothetical protein JL722_4783 [Aureococcus anophagefferens]
MRLVAASCVVSVALSLPRPFPRLRRPRCAPLTLEATEGAADAMSDAALRDLVARAWGGSTNRSVLPAWSGQNLWLWAQWRGTVLSHCLERAAHGAGGAVVLWSAKGGVRGGLPDPARGLAALEAAGALAPGERSALLGPAPPRAAYLAALGRLAAAVADGVAGDQFRGGAGFESEALKAVVELRQNMLSVPDELAARMPLAYVHFVQCLVDLLCATAPLALFPRGGAFGIALCAVIALFFGGVVEPPGPPTPATAVPRLPRTSRCGVALRDGGAEGRRQGAQRGGAFRFWPYLELIYLEFLRGEPGVPELLGGWATATSVVWVVRDAGRAVATGTGSSRSPAVFAAAYDARARTDPLGLAAAWLRCFRAAERGGFVLTDFKADQFTLDARGDVYLVDGPAPNVGPAAAFARRRVNATYPARARARLRLPARQRAARGGAHTWHLKRHVGCDNDVYAAPELVACRAGGTCAPFGAKADVYDAAAKYWILPRVVALAEDRSAAARLGALLPRMMSEDPRDRPTFSALLEELERGA